MQVIMSTKLVMKLVSLESGSSPSFERCNFCFHTMYSLKDIYTTSLKIATFRPDELIKHNKFNTNKTNC